MQPRVLSATAVPFGGKAHGTAKEFRRHTAGMDRRVRPVKPCICLSGSEFVVAPLAGEHGQYRPAAASAGGEMAGVQLGDRSGRPGIALFPDVRAGYFPARIHRHRTGLFDHLPAARRLLALIRLPEYRGLGHRTAGLGRRDDTDGCGRSDRRRQDLVQPECETDSDREALLDLVCK
jgi:hypothetical protein